MSQQRKNFSGGSLIRRYSKSDKAAIPFIKFGPLFGQDEEGSSVKKAKEEAWKHVVIFSKSSEATITEIYMSSIRNIENEAKASYFPELDALSSKDFRDMMLKDGCLFLQLCFSLFRNNVGNNIINVDDDVKFDDFPHLRNIFLLNRHKWMESILHVGNQIPLVVIRELLNKSYFRQVVQKGKWKEPSFDPAKRALFRILLSPLLHTGVWRMKSFPYCIGKRAQRLTRWSHQLEECCDVLHGIHLLFLGPEIDPEKEEYEDDDDDVEDDVEENKGAKDNDTDDVARYKAKNDNDDDDDDYTKLKNVIKLKQSGIHFRVSKEEGIRGITFKSSLIYPKLYLPPLFIGSHTQLLLQRLRQYEQNLDPSLREVSSYLMLMRDLVRTSQDAKILALDGIIKGNRKYVQKLPSILIDLTASDDCDKIIDTGLNPVKIEINSFYRPPWVTSYFTIVFLLTLLGMIISIIQTVYAMLAYHKPPPSN